jgi:ribosome-binding protein aMBF1 (putative translation factor)
VTFNLTQARLNAGHSIRGLADEIEVPEASIRRLEDGKGVHPANAKKVADYFDVRVTDLMPVQEAA